ncbi:MAG: hypothetical protein ACYDEB_12755 [Dehalococcoidia bacterium]
MTEPATHRSPSGIPRLHAAVALLLAILAAAVGAAGVRALYAAGPAPVLWEKQPAQITATLTSPAQTVSFDEVMSNQSDPNGFGGFAFTVRYDATVWQAPAIDMSPAVALFAAAGRVLLCSSPASSPGQTAMACASTGPFGTGPVWPGPQTLATVTLTLTPALAQTILGGGSGVQTTVSDTGVQLSNTCGEALNDGTGQGACTGKLLPGLAPKGVVIGPGSTAITITVPATPTATATSTATATATATATSTATLTATATSTATPSPTATATATRTATPTTTATSTATPSPTATAMPIITVSTATPTGLAPSPAASPPATTSRTPAATRTSGPTPCGFEPAWWAAHAAAWPVTQLSLGGQSYDGATLRQMLTVSGTPQEALTQQLIATRLNIAAYGDQAGIGPTAARADEHLARAGGFAASGVPPYLATGMQWLTAALAGYNRDCSAISTVLGTTLGGPPTLLPRTGVTDGGRASSWRATAITVLSLIAGVLLVFFLRRALFRDRD